MASLSKNGYELARLRTPRGNMVSIRSNGCVLQRLGMKGARWKRVEKLKQDNVVERAANFVVLMTHETRNAPFGIEAMHLDVERELPAARERMDQRLEKL